jgi:5-methylcytosine-specific restriction endonuclease McrA
LLLLQKKKNLHISSTTQKEGTKTKTDRIAIYNKCGGRCAYCGKKIELKDMQIDHIIPQINGWNLNEYTESIKNKNPSCRRCNHYKRAHSLEMFRHMLLTLPNRIRDIYICKVAEDYRIAKIEPFDGVFYFEKGEGWNVK